jgi:hypothetical protein
MSLSIGEKMLKLRINCFLGRFYASDSIMIFIIVIVPC